MSSIRAKLSARRTRTDPGQPRFQSRRRSPRGNVGYGRRQDIAFVHFFVEPEDRHARFASPFEKRPGDGSAPRGISGRREKWTLTGFVSGKVDDRGGNDLPEGDDDMDVGRAFRMASSAAGSFRMRSGWMTGMLRVRGESFDGPAVSILPRPAGLSGWVTTSGDVVAGVQERFEGGEGGLGTAEKNDAHHLLPVSVFS